MRDAHPRERTIGIDYYVSDTDGTGGELRANPRDFRVCEREAVTPEPLTSDPTVYTHLVIRVTLDRWETHEFARELSNRLGISRERISWAGTKDKHAHTTQLFSIQEMAADNLPEIQRATIEPIGRLGRRILLGDLAGNDFTITVRDPERPENTTDITAQLRAFGGIDGAVGVPNYFGPQRFGTTRPITHEVGFRILDRDWKGAVMTYIGNPKEAEPEETQAARAFVEETEDWTEALDRFPTELGYERSILHRLAETDADSAGEFLSALETLPTNLQRLFVHAAQSYAFNHILSKRLDSGLPFDRAVEGDVVCFTEQINDMHVPDPDRIHRVTDSVDTINRHITRGRALVTAPLVGTDTEFGRGEPGDLERDVLEDLDVTRTDFALPGALGSTGTRRPILVRTDLTHTVDPLCFSFSLPRGSYATVLLREYLKTAPEDL